MIDALYPLAVLRMDGGRNGDGQGWGPLPDRGGTEEQMRVVLHTTETNDLPGYNNGQHAPHWSYIPQIRAWIQHGRTDRRMGTLIGSTTTGVLGNEISIQVELVAYSDRDLAKTRGGLWVGDFTNTHYADLAAFVKWCRAELEIRLHDAYGPGKDFLTFLWGKTSATRMSKAQWLAAGGILTAHGAAPGNEHWDTGMLDLHRIIAESVPPDPPPPAPPIDTAAVLDDLHRIRGMTNKLITKLEATI